MYVHVHVRIIMYMYTYMYTCMDIKMHLGMLKAESVIYPYTHSY